MTRTAARPVATVAMTSVVALAVLAGCTSSETPSDTPTPQAGEDDVPAAAVSAPVTRVAGRLPDRDRLALRREVEALLGDYVTAAFLAPSAGPDGDPAAGDPFTGFTEGAARLAERKGAVLTRADLDADGGATVEVVSAEAPLNVLAPRGRPAGATARLDLELEVTPDEAEPAEESAEESAAADPAGPDRVRLQGRLLLTPVGQGWRVFGFDVTRTDR